MQSVAPLPTAPPAPARARYQEPPWRRALDWFERSNALAAREMRLALRSPRAWLLLSLYVSVLGAIVLAQFPADTSVAMWSPDGDSASSGVSSSQRGSELLQVFAIAQFFGVWLLVPSLSVGALHQEREGQTLESLLLSPLSPLQVVWGKLCGVLAMTFVLLVGTLPLTSLCFLLGGVAPEDVALRFFALLAWAMFCAGVGLYCAARTPNATKATAQAYGLSAVGLVVSIVMLGPGVALASVALLVWLARAASRVVRGGLKRVFPKPGAEGMVNGLSVVGLIAAAIGLILVGRGLQVTPILLTALLVFPYGVYVSQLAVNAAAHELAKRPEPAPPKREAWREVASAWQAAAAPDTVVYTRTPDGGVSHYSTAPGASATRTSTVASATTATYGVKSFLSDSINPIFARDLRHGVGGRAATLARWAYAAVILTQLFLIYFLSDQSLNASDSSFLANCVKVQLILVMMACAWLGSRAVAPERETQTLQQLLTLPMPARSIIGGKIASVLYFSLYVLLAGLPLVLMLPLAFVLSWGSALGLVVLQASWGLLAGAWGVFCSLHCGAVRRALAWSMGGVGFGLFGMALIQGASDAAARGGAMPAAGGRAVEWAAQVLSPLGLVESAFRSTQSYATTTYASAAYSAASGTSIALSILCVAALAAFLFASSTRAFTKLARQG